MTAEGVAQRGPTPETRTDVTDARWKIIRAANKHKLSILRPFPPSLFGMRQIQQAVCVARRNGLIHRDVFAAAGFNPGRLPDREAMF